MCSRILRYAWFDIGYTLMLQFTDLPEIHNNFHVMVNEEFPCEGGPVGPGCLEMANSGAP